MRKVYIYDDYQLSSGNGIGTFLKEFARCVAQWGDDIQLCMIMFRTNSEEFRIGMRGGMEYFFIPRGLCKNPFEECEPVIAILRKHIIDTRDTFFLINYTLCDRLMSATRKYFPLSRQGCVIHDFSWTAPLLGDVELFRGLVAKKGREIPFQYIEMLKLHRREADQYRIADSVVCLSEDSRDILQDCYFVPKEKIALIPHGADTIKKTLSVSAKQKWRASYYLNNNEKVILMVGRVCKTKGMFAYLNAFKKVLKKEPDCRLVIAGELCNAPDLLAAAGEAVIKITLTGLLDKDKLSCWYRMADIGVIPSYSEQYGYVGVEMMAYGLPIVASDGFGVRCMFQDGINALVAPIGNRSSNEYEQHLADCTLRLLSSLKLRKRLKDSARQILKRKYAFSEMEKHYKAIFMA